MPTLTRLTAALALCAATFASLPLQAADEPRYNQIALRAEVSQDVAHDLMHVTLYSEGQNSDPAKLAADTSEALNAAIAKARKVQGVTVQSGSRNSYPVYDKDGQKITGWRERAELRLESQDFATLSKLTAELLGELKMGGMDFAISKPSRKKNEDALLKDAVAAFKERAQLATDALGGKGYKLVSLNLNSGGFRPMPMQRMDAAPMAMSMAKSAPQEIEAGTSEVTISADGVIEVQLP
ncbi:SIMPL domain-containing protein [Pseudomonas sp. UL073]|uniref:SIMPL domain-containing protein n=1 Tax=Zestomonas insulae TaxID=2809017 RepID=A0ABS2IEL9_9GAMM|nr:SIMPL domain-containing protein [Pseudomonas insulae]MBM7061539.1 SIMPL domain-containing protein [Pseudomonas insulae]